MLTLALSRQPKVDQACIHKVMTTTTPYSADSETYNEPAAPALNVQLQVVLVPSLNNTILEPVFFIIMLLTLLLTYSISTERNFPI